MEQNRPKQTDQQATNAALAALAAAGNSFALGQLWEVKKYEEHVRELVELYGISAII